MRKSRLGSDSVLVVVMANPEQKDGLGLGKLSSREERAGTYSFEEVWIRSWEDYQPFHD